MNEADAVVSTAGATWQLVYATWALSGATLIVVIAAFAVSWLERREDRDRSAAAQDLMDAQGLDAIEAARRFGVEVRDRLAPDTTVPQFDLWEYLNRRMRIDRTLDYFLRQRFSTGTIPLRLSAAKQCLAEVEAALIRLKPDIADPQLTTAERAGAAATAERAVNGLKTR